MWTVKKEKESSVLELEDLKFEVAKHFSGPRSIEQGCDYISRLTTGSKRPGVDVSFQLHGSDSSQMNEVIIQPWTHPVTAFEVIDRRLSQGQANSLKISGEVEPVDPAKGAASQLNENATMQIQEARVLILFLLTKLPPDANIKIGDKLATDLRADVIKVSNDVENSKEKYLFESTAFPATGFYGS